MQASGLRRRAAARRDGHNTDRETRSELDVRVERYLGLLIGLLIVVLVGLLIRAFVRVVTVHDYERGLHYRRGRFAGLVDPGSHFTLRPFVDIRVIDGRPAFMTVEGQEVLTSDGVSLKVSLAARYVVVDPVAAVTGDQAFGRALYLELQLGLRDVVAASTIDELLAARAKVGPAVLERVGSSVARLGVELLAVEVRDLMVPGELKRLFAGVVAARKEGEAALERVRGETAALRNLANAGRLVEDNPGLLQLRVLQEIGGSSGNTVNLTLSDGQAGPAGGSTATSGSRAAQRGRKGAGDEGSAG